jgi:hypothetical protein
MSTQTKPSKYVGAVSAFLVVTALSRLPNAFAPIPAWAKWFELAHTLLLLLAGVGLFFCWRGFWHAAVAILVLQLAVATIAQAHTFHILGRAFTDTRLLLSLSVSLLPVLCLSFLLRREVRDFYGGQAAA